MVREMAQIQQDPGFWPAVHLDANTRAVTAAKQPSNGRGGSALRNVGEKLRRAWMAHTLTRANAAVETATCCSYEDFGWQRSELRVLLQQWREDIRRETVQR
jgi:hypothetical protein